MRYETSVIQPPMPMMLVDPDEQFSGRLVLAIIVVVFKRDEDGWPADVLTLYAIDAAEENLVERGDSHLFLLSNGEWVHEDRHASAMLRFASSAQGYRNVFGDDWARYLASIDTIKHPSSTLSDCRACGKESVYSRELDRYMHADGTNNRDCWVAITKGNA